MALSPEQKDMQPNSFSEAEWVQSLIREAERDVVFLFNIAAGAFGGPKPGPTRDDAPNVIKRISSALLEAGCEVGFGAPNTSTLTRPPELCINDDQLPATIASLYAQNPELFECLAFVRRESRQSENA
jgi:hypothetical protein